jgi:hypothetical protein
MSEWPKGEANSLHASCPLWVRASGHSTEQNQLEGEHRNRCAPLLPLGPGWDSPLQAQ